ncbi:helix-turn-helix domain-containing protein [Chryseobacterium vrystaatense]|uniref:DNA-binding transcriptional regulator, XRE-family HTH domain n=1 Tax=Chryseobacterium vrystaatense TaxID=307480 RepID=A0A1M4YY41_9FLAO|nr:helix-turn-helix transcriptional regulator [Chryseobacterium vrystaatense]SHF10477.1 DNA-binding transcriptional regulator, XRE-family HTH domain [Chryseobacterium vrystaatense]
MATLGTKLVRLRKNRGLSQTEVAGELEVSQPAYHKWESDEAKPGLENLIKLSRFFDVEIEELIENVTTINFPNARFEGSSYVVSTDSTINMHSSELLQSILKNQDQMSDLIEKQNQLIEALLKK